MTLDLSRVLSGNRLEPEKMSKHKFKVVLIKPSHYDAEGYVIQWWRSTIPSNSLASVYGIVSAGAQDKVLGPDVDIEIDAYDECNTVIDVTAAIRKIRLADGGFIGLVGVQSNQFPRALDLGRQFRAAGLPVVIGGFHVSGSISMLPELPQDLQKALDLGITLFAGEGEGHIADLLRDVDAGKLKPIYNYLGELPNMAAAILPCCRAGSSPVLPVFTRVSTPVGDALSNAASARSSTFRVANHDTGLLTTSKRSCERMPARASSG
ncbi:MAG: hypothetical protein ACREQK_11635, partial [Candidatus Binatia bacterium]